MNKIFAIIMLTLGCFAAQAQEQTVVEPIPPQPAELTPVTKGFIVEPIKIAFIDADLFDGQGNKPRQFSCTAPAPASFCDELCVQIQRRTSNLPNCVADCRSATSRACQARDQISVPSMAMYNELEKRLQLQTQYIKDYSKYEVSTRLLNENAIQRYAEIASRRVAAPIDDHSKRIKALEDKINELELKLLGKGGGNQNIRYQIPMRQSSQRHL